MNIKHILLTTILFVLLILSSQLIHINVYLMQAVKVTIFLAQIWLFKSIARKLASVYIFICMVILTISLFEVIFSFVEKTQGFEISLSNTLWFKKHWDLNSDGFRDEDFDTTKNSGNKIIFIGDSHTAGYGIKDVNKRYSNIIKASFPEKKVLNLGVPGVGTTFETGMIFKYARKNDIVIWQYFGDDILLDENVMPHFWQKEFVQSTINNFTNPYSGHSMATIFFVKNSFYFNYLYWHLKDSRLLSNMISLIKFLHSDEEYFNIHLNTIQKTLTWCQERDIKVVFVLMPFLINEKLSNEIYEDKIAAFLQKNNIPIIRISDFTKDLKPDAKMVNNLDGHPNELINSMVGKKLLDELIEHPISNKYE